MPNDLIGLTGLTGRIRSGTRGPYWQSVGDGSVGKSREAQGGVGQRWEGAGRVEVKENAWRGQEGFDGDSRASASCHC